MHLSSTGGLSMTKYYYIIHYSDGETENSFEEHGDDNFEGTFSSYEDAKDAAEYGISCFFQGGEILHLSNPGDYDAPDENEEIWYEIQELEVED